MSVIDHMTRFLVLVAISDKSAATIARFLEERVFSVFSAPETLHSDLDSVLRMNSLKSCNPYLGSKDAHVSVPPTRQLSIRACA